MSENPANQTPTPQAPNLGLQEFPDADQLAMDAAVQPASPASGDPPAAKSRSKKGIILIACSVLLVAVLSVLGGCYYILQSNGAFDETTFYSNTHINGIDCSGMTVSQVYAAITNDLGSYSLTIQQRGTAEVITGADIDLARRPDEAAIQAALDAQNDESLFTLLMQTYNELSLEIPLIRSYDDSLLQACLDALVCLDTAVMVDSVDAELVADDENATYYISEAVYGTTLDPDLARAAIVAALDASETTVNLEELYTNPSVLETDEDLVTQLQQLDTLLSAKITYNFSDRTYTCDNTVVYDCLIRDEDGTWTVDSDLLAQWVAQMAEETDTYQNHTFTTHDGETVYLPNGNYGWTINQETTAADLVEMVLSGTTQLVEPTYSHRNAATRATNDISGNYVEVDLTNQKVYLYVGGECTLISDCVSGLAKNSERATPSWGVWALSYKASPATLGTMDVQGYESEVTYWMPFNDGVGLHDASWRSKFGGTIYKTNGSHGCINLPYDAAETIYNTISAGWAIVVHGE